MHGNQWVLKIAVLKYYSVSKRGTTAKSNPKQATDPISLHTKFGDNSSNTFPLNERKPCVTPDIGRRTPDIGHRTAKKAKIIYPPPRGVDIMILSHGESCNFSTTLPNMAAGGKAYASRSSNGRLSVSTAVARGSGTGDTNRGNLLNLVANRSIFGRFHLLHIVWKTSGRRDHSVWMV